MKLKSIEDHKFQKVVPNKDKVIHSWVENPQNVVKYRKNFYCLINFIIITICSISLSEISNKR